MATETRAQTANTCYDEPAGPPGVAPRREGLRSANTGYALFLVAGCPSVVVPHAVKHVVQLGVCVCEGCLCLSASVGLRVCGGGAEAPQCDLRV